MFRDGLFVSTFAIDASCQPTFLAYESLMRWPFQVHELEITENPVSKSERQLPFLSLLLCSTQDVRC